MDRLKGTDLFTRYKRCLEGLTPGGSEFVDDPERCAATVEKIQSGLMNTLVRRVRELNEVEQMLRYELWMQHGHFGSLYGDDGEMQCSHRDCRLSDYKRSPIKELREQVHGIRLTRNLKGA